MRLINIDRYRHLDMWREVVESERVVDIAM